MGKAINRDERTDKNGPRHENPLPGEINPDQQKQNTNAHRQADKDMINDAELTARNDNDDLDEGESARLGEQTDLV